MEACATLVSSSVRSAAARRLAWLSTGFAACAVLGFTLGFVQVSADSDDTELYDLLLGSSVIEELL